MDKYKYKSIPLSSILHNGTTSHPNFIGIKYQNETTNNSKPLPFGYTTGTSRTPISNVTASYDTYTTVGSNPVTVPTGAKYIRFTGIGGAGGTGGSGGKSYDSDVPPGKKTANGGAGGAGGYGGRSYLNQTAVSPGATITVRIGARGPNGNKGNNDNTEHPNTYYTKGGSGNSPGTGGETYIKIGSTKYAPANGGTCGNGGASGYVYDGPGSSNTYGNGGSGNTGANGNGNSSNNGNWDLLNGNYGKVNAPSGSGGHSVIVWLYD